MNDPLSSNERLGPVLWPTHDLPAYAKTKVDAEIERLTAALKNLLHWTVDNLVVNPSALDAKYAAIQDARDALASQPVETTGEQ